MLASDTFMVVFRVIHILAGVIWVGSVFLLVVFVQPSAAAIAPAGAPFMTELLGKRHLVDWILTTAAITVLGGLFLYWHDWHTYYGSFSEWTNSSFGGTLTFGALCAIAAMVIGIVGTRPTVGRFFKLAGEVAASGAPPSPEVGAQMVALQNRLKILARISLVLLIFAVLGMATARYL
ncbi:MAG TPA: hypothetical protein VK646_00815 [Actinomycetota bacterium]|nr:hypothetical protein [Actinomycetota bacterium]